MEGGFILQKLSGTGTVFTEFDGHVVEYELKDGQEIVIDTGHLAAMSGELQDGDPDGAGVKRNMLFGGRGSCSIL